MASSKNVCRSILPGKRLLDDGDDGGLEEYQNPRKAVSKYPPPKKRPGVQVVRDFPPGYGIKEESLATKVERNPNVNTFDSSLKVVHSRSFKDNKIKSLKPRGLGRNDLSFATRPSGKVKFWDPTKEGGAQEPKVTTTVTRVVSKPDGKVKFLDPNSVEEGHSQKSKDDTLVLSSKEQKRREKIKEAMAFFEKCHEKLYDLNKRRPMAEKIPYWRVALDASKEVQEKMKWMDDKKTIGSLCGVLVGDKFKYRAQLKMIGLHCQIQAGVDYTRIDGRNLAISIVDSHRYSNKRPCSDVLYYSGHGGIRFLAGKQLPPKDQKLERGNLALKNSMIGQTPVRVIRKLQWNGNEDLYVYDGLYVVQDYTEKKGEQGKNVFMFKLRRKSGQPPLLQMLTGGGYR